MQNRPTRLAELKTLNPFSSATWCVADSPCLRPTYKPVYVILKKTHDFILIYWIYIERSKQQFQLTTSLMTVNFPSKSPVLSFTLNLKGATSFPPSSRQGVDVGHS